MARQKAGCVRSFAEDQASVLHRGSGIGWPISAAPVTASTVVDNDADDTIAKVNASNDQVALGQSVARTMNPANDVDMVRFTVVAGQKVGFEVDPRNGSKLNTDLRLFDANGNQLAANNRAGSGAASASAFSGVASRRFRSCS